MSDVEARWHFLAPWIRWFTRAFWYLEQSGHACFRQRFESLQYDGFVEFYADPESRQARIRRDREALELIGRALSVDRDFWKLLRHGRFSRFDPCHYDVEDLVPRVELEMPRAFRLMNEDAVREFLGVQSASQVPISQAFMQAISNSLFGTEITTKIPIWLRCKPERIDFVADWRQLLTDINLIVKWMTKEQGNSIFDLERIELPLVVSALEEALPLVEALVATDVAIDLTVSFERPIMYPLSLRTWVRNVFNAAALANSSLPHGRELTHSGRWFLCELDDAISLFSALAVPSRFRKITIEPMLPDESLSSSSVQFTKWLTYALFSSNSQGTVKDFTWNAMTIDDSCVAAASAIMAADDPAVYLSEASDIFDTEPKFVSLASTSVMMHSALGECYIGDESSSVFRVIHRDTNKNTLQIIVSGVGLCDVDRADTRPVSIQVSDSPTQPEKLESLTLSVTNGSMRSATSFVSVIGQHLKTLTFKTEEVDPLDDAGIELLIRNCPQLRLLAVENARLGSLGVFTGAESHVQCINLTRVSTSEDAVLRLLDALVDTTSRIARCVNELVLDVSLVGEDASGLSRLCAQRCIDMLHSNQRVSFVRVLIQPSIVDAVGPSLESFDGEVLPRKDDSRWRKGKLAFLAAYQCREMQDRAMSFLDHRCLAHIFDFLSAPILRCVIVQAPYSPPMPVGR